MQIKLDKHKRKNGIRTQVRIVEAYRPGPGMSPRQRQIENLGYLEDQDDPEQFLTELKARVARMNREASLSLPIDFSMKNHDPKNRRLNYGCLLIHKAYCLLGIPDFLRSHRLSRASYDLERIFFLLVAMRILDPDSKRASFMAKDTFYQMEVDCSLLDIYRALDEIASLKPDLELFLNKRTGELMERDSSCFYLDATNYYFEKDYAAEGTLAQNGVSKEHRLDPIVQMGLVLDSNGLPVLSDVFPGNTSDSLLLVPLMEKVIRAQLSERYIVVADKGLNSSGNIDFLVNGGNGFLFSQILRGNKGKRYHSRLFSDGYTSNADGSYKYKTFVETYQGRDTDGKKVERERRVLLYWSRQEAERARRKREQKVAKAQKALGNQAYRIDHSKNAYLKEVPYEEETGEIREDIRKSYRIDEEKIQKEAMFDGYFCLVTSELEYDERKMRKTYGNLWKIEQSFRITKSDLEARPVYLQLDERIRAHFFICHVALLILRLMEHAMGGRPVSMERVQRVLSRCVLEEPAGGIVHLHQVGGKNGFETYLDKRGRLAYTLEPSGQDEVFEDYQKLLGAFHIDLDAAYMRKEEFNQTIKKGYLALQK